MTLRILLGGLTAVCISTGALAQTNPQVTPPLANQSGDLTDKLQRNDGVIKPPRVDTNMPTPTPSTNSEMPVIKPSETPRQTEPPHKPQ